MRLITITNETTVLTDAQVLQCMHALQVQCSRDFGPAWGIWCQLSFSKAPPATGEVLHLLNDSDQAGALGYHDQDRLRPQGFVFVETSIAAGDAWQATASHELLEMLVDPLINDECEGLYQGKDAVFVKEVCDAVENDEYLASGVPVSNFVYPAWFVTPATGGKYDHLGKLSAPFTLSRGGYISYATTLGQWQQWFGDGAPQHQRTAHPLSRRHRRMARKGKAVA